MDHDAHRTTYEDVGTAPVGPPTAENLERLRELLFGEELRDLAELKRRLDELGITPDNLADNLPAAVALRSRRDKQLARALAPSIEDGLHEAVQRNPQKITDAIFPVLGPAIRKAIAETMASLVQTINRGIENSISPHGLRWRFEAWRTGVPYGQVVIKHALVYRVEQVFLIHGETGLLLAHVTAEGVETPDADIVYSMLAAIKDFVHDSFKANAAHGMRRVSVADTVIFAQQGPLAVVGAVVRGQAPESPNERLQTILERIHLEYSEELENFEGDTAPFADATLLLQDGLETQLSTDQPGKSRAVTKVAWGLAGLLVLALGFLYVQSILRWNGGVRALRDAPGIVVVEADRGWRTSSLSGLLDPDAQSPMTLLADNGLDTSRILPRWERYISTDSSMVHKRLERFFQAAPDVTWQLSRDSVVAQGSAPPEWLETAVERGVVPGVSVVDVSGVSVQIPDTLLQLGADLAQHRIEFPSGSSFIPFRFLLPLDSVADMITTLVEAASVYRLSTTIDLIGRTDTAGASEANQDISRGRAEAVRDALVQFGVAANTLRVVGIGSTDPITSSGGSGEQANRSVSFAARFSHLRGGVD